MSDVENVYGLAPGQVIRVVPPPFPAQRREILLKLPVDSQERAGPEGPTAMMLEWECGGLRIKMSQFRHPRRQVGGFLLREVADFVLNTHHWDWEGDHALLAQPIPGDIVLRRGADEAVYLNALEELAGQLWPGEKVTIVGRVVRRVVSVLSGTWSLRPLDDFAASRGRVELFMHELDADRMRKGERSGDVATFAANLGRYSGTQLFIEADAAPDQITWYENRLFNPAEPKTRNPYEPGKPIENVLSQTGLSLSRQIRSVRRLFIEAA